MDETKTPITSGQKSAHTPLPWRQSSLAPLYLIAGDDPKPILSVGEYDEQGDIDYIFDNAAANTEFIMRAVNCHQELLDACKGIVSTYVFLDSLTAGMEPQHSNTLKALAMVRAAIQKAESGEWSLNFGL